MRIVAFSLWVVLGCVFAGGTSMAANWGFLKDAPIAHFTKEDMELFTGALQNGLDQAADGADVSWSNPKTGAGGTLTFLDTRAPAETICRRVQIANKAKGQQSKVINTFCKNAAEEWKVHR